MQLNTNQLIQKLKQIKPEGYEVSLKMGVLTLTKYVFFKRKRFYIFSFDQFWIFTSNNGYTELEFIGKYSNWIWHIDQTIN